MTRLERLFDWFRLNDGVPYYAGGGDNDHDGTPDRADVTDGNGVDCSGAVWAAYAYAWEPDPPPFPLSSTSGYAFMAQDRGLWVPLNALKPGDILLHSGNGNVYQSDGPVGHTELFGNAKVGAWRCWGSSGSGRGVGAVDRRPSFWQAALRIPGLNDAAALPVLTAQQLAVLVAALRTLDNARKDEPAMPKHIIFKGHSHVFALVPDAQNSDRLRHDYYTGTEWKHDYPAEITLPSARFRPGQTLDVKTKDQHGSENPIDVYAVGKLGEFVHVWWNGTAWNTEVKA